MDGVFIIRIVAVGLGVLACAAIVWKHEHVVDALRRFFCTPSMPINLAIVRVVVFGTILTSALESEAEFLASLPPEFQRLPRGWVWLADTGLLDPEVVRSARILLVVAASLAVLGALTSVATVVASLCAILVFGVENFYFKIGHSLHVPILSACVIAASPAGDAWSVDALVRRRRGAPRFEPSTSYTIPVRFCWLLVGTMYLFPGLWKLWESGDQWVDGTKLVSEMFDKWAQLPDFTPTYRFDRARALLIVLGTWTLILEVGFFFMLFTRVTRVAAALFASSFHIGIGFTLGIWFSPIVPLILLADLPELFELRALKPLARWFDRLGKYFPRILLGSAARDTTRRNPRWASASFLVGVTWLGAMFVAGLGPIDSWPVAVYPRFADRKATPTTSGMSLGFFLLRADGSERELAHVLDVLGDTAASFRVTRTVVEARRRKDYRKLTQYENLFLTCATRVTGGMQQGDQLRVVYYRFPADPALREGRGRGHFILESDPHGLPPREPAEPSAEERFAEGEEE